ncbi:MAG: M28 family peptidase [Nitrospirota bacterium]
MIGLVVAAALLGVLGWWLATMFWMPGASVRGALAPLTPREAALVQSLRRDVDALAGEIGERNFQQYEALLAAADYLDDAFVASGYQVRRQRYEVNGRPYDNLEVERRGASRPDEIVIVGAHYDSVVGAPGANDNGTGVAAVLALAEAFAAGTPARTVRFVAFVNEEPPFAHTPNMGSVVYATRSRERGECITAMVSLETMGYFADEPGSQRYPSVLRWVYPDTADFIAFVGDPSSRAVLTRAIKSFRKAASIPSEGGALPANLPGVGWSDHWSFWQADFPAIMVTDTALFRYSAYHTDRDTPDQVDYDRLARVVVGLERVVADLAE